ncbi:MULTISPECIES: TrkH family potassium uptake protein [Anaerotruncus]|jgi:trk system potassium uptake protein TrkH|uniref:TrkH family potassium uptake protein n=1 Tax=Anaerotruncus TaxID=244127 RepID=UPI000834A81F|nr:MULTISPECIES: TrkH family potassium uptake protein [Anaerotruncus]RGX56833.1 TrkH family potassium uptake protein [Anaerotruncus sp. AF02-27]
MNYRMILFLIGYILRVEAAFMVPALAVALLYHEQASVSGFFITILILLAVSMLTVFVRPEKRTLYVRDGMFTVALAWIAVSFFGALPFFLSGSIPSFVDCIFETVSGFTTTGASILTNVEGLPFGMLYWRSFTHWLGGMGVLVFLLAIVPLAKGSGNSLHLLRAESPGPQVGKLVPKMRDTATILYGIYIVLSLIEVIFLLAGGMSLFDSITTMFGTAGTGGFGVKNDSIAGYSPYLQVVVTVFMALFGVNFNIFYLLLIREFSKAFHNEELRAYLGIMLGSIMIITVDIMPMFGNRFGEALRHAAFQVSSIMTTTGFATTDFNVWPELSRVILVVLMIVGASAGSTGGGIKVSRLLLLLKSAKRDLQKMLRPRAVKTVRMDGEMIDDATLRGVHAYMTVYCAIAVVSILLIALDNFSFESNLTAVLACLNNIGPGLGVVGPIENYSVFSDFSKVILTANMLIGRLEIFPILLLFAPSMWKKI